MKACESRGTPVVQRGVAGARVRNIPHDRQQTGFSLLINGPLQIILDYFQEIEPVYFSCFPSLLPSYKSRRENGDPAQFSSLPESILSLSLFQMIIY